ncbi:MAG TPA: hypothetical protein VEA99_03010 [Gemmatimonadaceae bacterium]|nr:hypothetical protein [Gemmatimonadaceae bacterium]
MAIWTRLRQELDRAGKVAQQAIDEGRVRLDLHRARGRAEKAAASLGWALYRARKVGGELEPEQYDRLAAEIAAAESEAARYQAELDAADAKPSPMTTPQGPV